MNHTKEQDTPDTASQNLNPITLEEIERANQEVRALQQQVVGRVQQLLNELKGRRGASQEQNGRIANTVYKLANSSGTELLAENKEGKNTEGSLRWSRGVFELRTTNRGKKPIVQEADFPELTARASVFKERKPSIEL